MFIHRFWYTAICNEGQKGNRICEPDHNHAYCDYDGGDCCHHWTTFAEECGNIDITTDSPVKKGTLTFYDMP